MLFLRYTYQVWTNDFFLLLTYCYPSFLSNRYTRIIKTLEQANSHLSLLTFNPASLKLSLSLSLSLYQLQMSFKIFTYTFLTGLIFIDDFSACVSKESYKYTQILNTYPLWESVPMTYSMQCTVLLYYNRRERWEWEPERAAIFRS